MIFLINIRINVDSRVVSSLQDKHIEFDCQILVDILGISNKGPMIF